VTRNIIVPGVYGGVPVKYLKSLEYFIEKRKEVGKAIKIDADEVK